MISLASFIGFGLLAITSIAVICLPVHYIFGKKGDSPPPESDHHQDSGKSNEFKPFGSLYKFTQVDESKSPLLGNQNTQDTYELEIMNKNNKIDNDIPEILIIINALKEKEIHETENQQPEIKEITIEDNQAKDLLIQVTIPNDNVEMASPIESPHDPVMADGDKSSDDEIICLKDLLKDIVIYGDESVSKIPSEEIISSASEEEEIEIKALIESISVVLENFYKLDKIKGKEKIIDNLKLLKMEVTSELSYKEDIIELIKLVIKNVHVIVGCLEYFLPSENNSSPKEIISNAVHRRSQVKVTIRFIKFFEFKVDKTITDAFRNIPTLENVEKIIAFYKGFQLQRVEIKNRYRNLISQNEKILDLKNNIIRVKELIKLRNYAEILLQNKSYLNIGQQSGQLRRSLSQNSIEFSILTRDGLNHLKNFFNNGDDILGKPLSEFFDTLNRATTKSFDELSSIIGKNIGRIDEDLFKLCNDIGQGYLDVFPEGFKLH